MQLFEYVKLNFVISYIRMTRKFSKKFAGFFTNLEIKIPKLFYYWLYGGNSIIPPTDQITVKKC